MLALIVTLWLFTRDGDTSADDAESVPGTRVMDTVVTLDSAGRRIAGIELTAATAGGADHLVANGAITYDANHVSVVSPRVEGRVVSVRADLGDEVRAGQTLAILESSEVGQTRADLARARANVEAAKRNYEREKRLFDQSISSQKELLDAEAVYRSAQADAEGALAKLRAIGATAGEGASFGLAPSIAGTVVERHASPGLGVGPSASLFTVADLRHVWITVDVYEADLARVRRNAIATITPTALPGETFTGRVTYAGGVVDTASRTFKVRVELENQGRRLRPGMFAQVSIASPPESGSKVVTLPEEAVQNIDGRPVVFVAMKGTRRFVARAVVTDGQSRGGRVSVTSGLHAGDLVVTKGAFQLKAELLKSRGESE